MEYKQRVCKKCLIRDMSEEEYFSNMYTYLANLDEEIKANQEIYEERLNICKDCDNLINGLCKICGCFVEMRAAILKNYCPTAPAKW
ncbi:DUF6171 family protein [Anaeromicropila populeti]|uniref:Uncharacterized protein n=1 Tax=Anaeromicropila populeti TaxID=37658 RepID=A0A1I6LNU6_9FIRM|nr:DUF6171 family protein [Anaeromicropila populeti]SFS05174.1 hypothetical protein SAMN05661086_03453 [Anaeromicropila populeti]